MRKTMNSRMTARMLTSTILHTSVRARASKAWVRMIHRATKHTTGKEKMRMNERLWTRKTMQKPGDSLTHQILKSRV